MEDQEGPFSPIQRPGKKTIFNNTGEALIKKGGGNEWIMASFFPDFILSLTVSENKYDRVSHLTLEKLNESKQFAICQATCFICACMSLTASFSNCY